MYDLEDRPVKVLVSNSPICHFSYDGDGARVKRVVGNVTVHYVGGIYEKKLGSPAVVTKYYFANLGSTNRLIAFSKDSTLRYVGTDHLGSTIRVASSTFTNPDQMRYTPYGVSRDSGSSLNTDQKFTSQIEDASIGLYRSFRGRMPKPGNPQALNWYVYRGNSPAGRNHADRAR